MSPTLSPQRWPPQIPRTPSPPPKPLAPSARSLPRPSAARSMSDGTRPTGPRRPSIGSQTVADRGSPARLRRTYTTQQRLVHHTPAAHHRPQSLSTLSPLPLPLPLSNPVEDNPVQEAHTPDPPRARRKRPKLPAPPQARATPGPVPQPYLARAPGSITPQPEPSSSGLILPSDHMRSVAASQTRYATGLASPPSVMPGERNSGSGTPRPLPTPTPPHRPGYAAGLIAPPAIIPGGRTGSPLPQVPGILPLPRPVLPHGNSSRSVNRTPQAGGGPGRRSPLPPPLDTDLAQQSQVHPGQANPTTPRRRAGGRRIVNNVALSRRPTVSSREDHLSRRASMRRVNVWDDLPDEVEPLPEFPDPSPSYVSRNPPTFSSVDPSPRTGRRPAPQRASIAADIERIAGRPDSPPPPFDEAIKSMQSPSVDDSEDDDTEEMREDRRMWNADILQGFTLEERVAREAERRAARALAQQQGTKPTGPAFSHSRGNSAVSVDRAELEAIIREANGTKESSKEELERAARQTLEILGGKRATKEEILAAARAALDAKGKKSIGSQNEPILPTAPAQFVASNTGPKVITRNEEPGVLYRLVKPGGKPKSQSSTDNAATAPASQANRLQSSAPSAPSSTTDDIASIYGMGRPASRNNQVSPSPRPPSPTPRNPSGGSVSSPPTRHDRTATPPLPTRLNSNGRSATPQFGQDERNRGVSPAFGIPGLNFSDPQLNSTDNQMAGNLAPAAASTDALLQTKKEILEALEKERPKAQDLPKPVHMTKNPVGAVVSLPEEPGIFYRLVSNKDEGQARTRKASDGGTAPPPDLQPQRSHSPQIGHHRTHSASQLPTAASLRLHRTPPRPTATDPLPRHERHGSFSDSPSNLRSTSVDDSPSARNLVSQAPPAPPAPPPPLPPRPPIEYIAEYNAPVATPPFVTPQLGTPQHGTPQLGTPQHGAPQSTPAPGSAPAPPQALHGLGISRTHGSSASISSLATPSAPPRTRLGSTPLPVAPEQPSFATPTPPRRPRLPRIPSSASANSSPALSTGAFSTPTGAARTRSPAPKPQGSGPAPLPPVAGDAVRTPPSRSTPVMVSHTPPRIDSPLPTETTRPQPATATVPVAQPPPRAESPFVGKAVSPPVQLPPDASTLAPSANATGPLPSGQPLPSTAVMDLSSPTTSSPAEDPVPRVRSPLPVPPRPTSQSPPPSARQPPSTVPPRPQVQAAPRSPVSTVPNRTQSPLPVVTVDSVPPIEPVPASPPVSAQATPIISPETPATVGVSSVHTPASPEPAITVPLRSVPSSNSVHSMASAGSSTTPPIAASTSMPALGAYSMLSAAPGSGRYGTRSGANSPEVSLDSPSSMVDRLTPVDNSSIKSGSTGSASVNQLPTVPERQRSQQGEHSPRPSPPPPAAVLVPQPAPAPATEGSRLRPRWMPQWGSSTSSRGERGEATSQSKQIFGDLWRRPTNRTNTEPVAKLSAKVTAGPQHRHTHSEGEHFPVPSASPQPDDSKWDESKEPDRPQPERSASASSTSSQSQAYSLPPGALPSALSPRLHIPSRATDSPMSPDLALSSLYVPMPPPRAPEPIRRSSARRPGQPSDDVPQLLQSPITEEPEEAEEPEHVQPADTVVGDKEETVGQVVHVEDDVEHTATAEKEDVEEKEVEEKVEQVEEKLEVDHQEATPEVDHQEATTNDAEAEKAEEPQDEPVTEPQSEDEGSEGELEAESTFHHRAPAVPPSLPPLFAHSYDPGEHSSLLADGLPSEWHSTPTPDEHEELSPNREAALLRRDLTETPGRSPRPKSIAAGKRPAPPPPPPQLLTVPAVAQLKKGGVGANPPSPLNVSPEIASLAASTSALLTLLEADERPVAESSKQGAAKAAVAHAYRHELAQQREIEAQIHESLELEATRRHVETPEPRNDEDAHPCGYAALDDDSEGQDNDQPNGRRDAAHDNGDAGRRPAPPPPPPPPPRTRPVSTPAPQSASSVEPPSSAGLLSPYPDGNNARHQSLIPTSASSSNVGTPIELRRRAPGPPPARPPPPPPPKSPSKRPPPPPPPSKKRSSLPLSAQLAERRAGEGDVFSFPLGHSAGGLRDLRSPLTLDCEDATESLLQPPPSASTSGGKSALVSPLDPHPPTIFAPPLPRRTSTPPPGISQAEGLSRDIRGSPSSPRPSRRTPPPPPPPRNAADIVAGRSGRGAFAARHQLLSQMASSSTSSLDATPPESEEQGTDPATPRRRPPVYSRSPQPWPSRAPAVSNGTARNHSHSPDSEPPTASSQELVTPVAPTAPPHEVPEDAEVTDLDVFVSRLEGTGREYEGLNRVTEFVGGAPEAGASPTALATLIRAPVVEMQRRVNKDGRVKLKLAVLDVRVSNCPICLSQFRRDEQAVVLPRCGHVSHGSCARRWFNESSLCMVCRTPLGDE